MNKTSCSILSKLCFMYDRLLESRFSTDDRKPFVISFSTKYDSLSIKRFCVMVPLSSVLRSMWLNLTVDLFSFIHDLKIGTSLKKLQSITVYPFCFLSQLAVTSCTITDSASFDSSRNFESKSSVIYQVLDVPKIRLNEWKQTELINFQSTNSSKNPEKISEVNTVDKQNSGLNSSNTSSSEVQRNTSDKQNSGKQRIFLQVNKVCINEQSSTTTKKTFIRSNITKDPRSFSAGAVVNHSSNNNSSRNSNNDKITLNHNLEGSDKSNQSKTVNDTKSERDEKNSVTQKLCQSTCSGSLYLFNSLPQPAPNYFITEHNKDIDANETEVDDTDDDVICSESSYFQRISVDQNSLKELTDTELKFKVIMASASQPSKTTSTLHFNELNNNHFNNKNAKEGNTPTPIDLAGYERSDDLSASFEESLLASLKQAAMGGNFDSDLLLMKQELTRKSVNTTDKSVKATGEQQLSGISKSIPLPSQSSPRNHIGKNIINSTEDEKCDIVNTLRKQILNVSFSDHDDYGEGEDVTTSDGLGSLIYLRYHLTRHHQHCQHYPQNYHQHLGNEYLQQRDNLLVDINHQISPKSEISTYRKRSYHSRNDNDNSSTLSLSHQSTQSNEDISQLITGVEVSSHWGTGTLTSSNESLPYSICDNVTSRGSCEPPNHQLKQHHTCTLNRTNSKNTLSDMKEKQSNDNNSINSNNQLVELIYDSILNCYYDPKSGRFYELI
uniref:CFA20 domain-containing protein n=1 Tax=Trichobilharzia regenti TaxID=157069 RepID=A0AA85K306_TRIRE|nr:unnamed protein product [Trichobilharzia regenti]